jgi:hypothetical protein
MGALEAQFNQAKDRPRIEMVLRVPKSALYQFRLSQY